MIRPVTPDDAPAIARIYNYYVANTVITFEEEAVSNEEMTSRIAAITAKYPWFVWEEKGEVLGYAYAGPWKARASYRHSVESSVYLDHAVTGRGMGRKLYEVLLPELEKRGVHNVIAGISMPVTASIKMHEKMGFRFIGSFTEVGCKNGEWIDVGYWELLLGGAMRV